MHHAFCIIYFKAKRLAFRTVVTGFQCPFGVVVIKGTLPCSAYPPFGGVPWVTTEEELIHRMRLDVRNPIIEWWT